jgi:hypothetical protein
MNKSRLELIFRTDVDKKAKISIDNPKEDLTEVEIRSCMENIISKNIFKPKSGSFVEIEGARIVTTGVEEIEL